jgi:hypothetical protein
MKKIAILLAILFLATGCATQIPYTKQVFTPPPKADSYKLPADPFTGVPAPTMIYLKKDATGKYVVCPKEEVELYAFTSTELGKITIRLNYYKDERPQLENLVNLHIQRENLLIDLIVDQNVLKELLREMNVDLQNKINSDKMWWSVEKGGYIAVILGMLIEMGILIAK